MTIANTIWNQAELQRVLDEIEAIVRSAAEIILAASDQAERSSYKSSHKDLVTEYDVRVQQYLEEHLRRLLPQAGFLGEEEGTRDIEGRELFYIVDPIDGTSNFVSDYRHSGISVALMQVDKSGKPAPLLSLIYNPYLDECFRAARGQGAQLDRTPIQVSTNDLDDSLILFGTSPYERKYAPQTFRVIEALFMLSRDIRRSGAAVLDMSYVACGRASAFFEIRLSPWDYAAAALIIEEAGGVITNMEGEELPYLETSSIVAAAPEHHWIILQVLRDQGL